MRVGSANCRLSPKEDGVVFGEVTHCCGRKLERVPNLLDLFSCFDLKSVALKFFPDRKWPSGGSSVPCSAQKSSGTCRADSLRAAERPDCVPATSRNGNLDCAVASAKPFKHAVCPLGTLRRCVKRDRRDTSVISTVSVR